MCTSTFQQCTTLGGATNNLAWAASRSGQATIRVGANLFSQQAPITFRGAAASAAVNTAAFGEGSIYADAPRGVLIGGGVDTFIVNIYANVGPSYTLFSWGISMDFVPSSLSFVSMVSPNTALFSPPVVTREGNTISANTAAASGAPDAGRKGASVHIATLTMTVAAVPTSTEVVLNAITNLRATFLVNTFGSQFATDSVAHVYDFMGIDTILGGVRVAVARTPVPIGMHAYPFPFHVIIAPGSTVSSAVTVTGIIFWSIFNTPNTAPSPALTCNSGGSCAGITTSSTASTSMTIAAVSGTFSINVPVRVYYTTGMRVHVNPTLASPGEMSRIRVFVRWMGDPAGVSDEVEITRTPYNVPVASNNTQVIEVVTDGIIRGVSPGAAGIFFPSAQHLGITGITVLSPAMQSRASLIFYRGSPQWSGSITSAPTLAAGAALSQEGESHTVMAVSESTGMLIRLASITSSHPATYAITTPSLGGVFGGLGYAWNTFVPVDAQRVPCVNLSLSGSSTTHNVTSRNVEVPVPDITGVSMCCSNAVRLTLSSETAMINAVYAQTSYTAFSTTLHFGDGSSVPVTTDSRYACVTILVNGEEW